MTEAADGLTALKTSGVVVLWRPFSEMNGAHFWHGHEKRSAWIALWRHMYDYFTQVRDLDNLIWVYEADKGPHDKTAVDYYYPGDDVVDVFSHNFFDDDWRLPFDSDELLRRHPKVSGFAQTGSENHRDGSWSNTVVIDAIQLLYPRCSFFAAWNSFSNGGTYVALAIADQLGDIPLMSNVWVVTRDDLSWTNFYTPPSVAILGTHGPPLITWRGGRLQESTSLSAWQAPDQTTFPHNPTSTQPTFFRCRGFADE